tara:strand:- start:1108 stop:1668 length:561 start_codon:yes stop_codon:yes gene_type:complete
MYLIAGLGNKGKKYTDTRHNVGFKVIDKIITQYDFEKYKESNNCHTFKGKILEKKVLLMKPMTYMNNSGKAVSEIATFYKIPVNKIFIIHDDIDLSVSRIKVKYGGSDAGHNGIKSIDMHIGRDYFRIRIGVGKPNNFLEAKDYVLKKFSNNDFNKIKKKSDKLVDNISYLLKNDINTFLNIISKD